MATLTADATLGTALTVDCGHHVATARTQTTHVTEFRKPCAVRRNSKTAEVETIANTFDSTASSGMGAWESVLDYSQYSIDFIYYLPSYVVDDYVIQYDVTVNDRQTITLAQPQIVDDGSVNPNTISDSDRIAMVFDFTEYHECTPSTTSGNITIKYTATGTGSLEVRTTDTESATVNITSGTKEYITTLDSYSIDNGFVYVWFKGAGIGISNITATITAQGRSKVSLTPVNRNDPVVSNNILEIETSNARSNQFERDSIISFDGVDLSIWPSSLQSEVFDVDSLVNFIGIQDNGATTYSGHVNFNPPSIFASTKTISADRAQATENHNPNQTQYEASPTSKIQLVDNAEEDLNNQSWRIGFAGKGYVEFGDHLFLPMVTVQGVDGATNHEEFGAMTVSLWWYGANIPSTFIMADDPDATYNVDNNFGDRSVNIKHNEDNNYNNFSIAYPTGGTPPLVDTDSQGNRFGRSAENKLTAKFLKNRNILNSNAWNNIQISFQTQDDTTYAEILQGVNHPVVAKAYINNQPADIITAVNTPEQASLPTTQHMSNEMYIGANPNIGTTDNNRGLYESFNTILNASYLGDDNGGIGIGSEENTQNAFYFIDNQFLDLDVQSNRDIFQNTNGTPKTDPKINGQTPKIFISGNYKNINNNGTLPITKRNITQLNLVDNNIDTIVGGAPTALILNDASGVKHDRDIFEAEPELPVITFDRMTNSDLKTRSRTSLNRMGIDLAYVYPAQGTFQHGFLKSKLLLNVNLTSGALSLDTRFTTTQTANMRFGDTVSLDNSINFDTTTGKIHVFRFDPMSLDTAFTSTQSGSRLVTGTVDSIDTAFAVSQPTVRFSRVADPISFDTAFTSTQTGFRIIKDPTAFTLANTTDLTTTGKIFRFEPMTFATAFAFTPESAKIHVFRFDPVTLASAFDINVFGGIANIRSGAIAVDTSFGFAVDGGVEVSSGLLNIDTAFTTNQTGKIFRFDPMSFDTAFATTQQGQRTVKQLGTITIATAFATASTGSVLRKSSATLASAFATASTGKIFRFDPVTLATSFTFTPESAKIHIYRFSPRTLNIQTTFNPNTGKIHIFDLEDITLPIQTQFDRTGGLRIEATQTMAPAFTVNAIAPIPLSPITLATAFAVSQPTVEIVKQANKVFAPTQNRIRFARTHPRIIDADRLETVTSSGITEWQQVAQWSDFDDFSNKHQTSHRATPTQTRSFAVNTQTRIWLAPVHDLDAETVVMNTTYLVNNQNRTHTATHSTVYTVANQLRQINTQQHSRTVLSERLT